MNPAPNLVLVGPMGAGKTSIGKRLAARLGLAFVDCDHRLEEITGAPVPLIFECEGEAGFRARESLLIAELMRGTGQLVATGGGAVLAEDNRRHLRARGFVVHLQVSVDQQIERLAAERGPVYRDIADLAFDAEGLGVAIAAERLGALLEQRWTRSEAA